jgi:hypothetical protein
MPLQEPPLRRLLGDLRRPGLGPPRLRVSAASKVVHCWRASAARLEPLLPKGVERPLQPGLRTRLSCSNRPFIDAASQALQPSWVLVWLRIIIAGLSALVASGAAYIAWVAPRSAAALAESLRVESAGREKREGLKQFVFSVPDARAGRPFHARGRAGVQHYRHSIP